MNSYAKGKRIELKARKELEKEGYLVEQAKMIRFGQKDLFGIFDLIALPTIGIQKESMENTTIKLIQIKSNRITKSTVEGLKEFYRKINKPNYAEIANVEYWIWKDRKGFDKFILYDSILGLSVLKLPKKEQLNED